MDRRITERMKFAEGTRIPVLGGLWYRWLVRADNRDILRASIPAGPLNGDPRPEKILCSLTSYPARIAYVSLAIKSLMLQTVKPDRIILWLAEEQFPERRLPADLTDLERYGLEIRWMHDLYGHKKYYYPVKEQTPEEVVITFDDDIIYSPRAIERLMVTHRAFPGVLVCERGQVFNAANMDNPGRWDTISPVGITEPTFSMNPSPGGGCLIPYGAFHEDALDEDLIRKLAYKNDDLWYMFMCAAKGTRMIKTRKRHKSFSVIEGSQAEQMATENVMGNRNAVILKGLVENYPEAWRRIRYDKD